MVVGRATRANVATRSRFGRGARHRTIRLREPPASGALRLPALHARLSPRRPDATAMNRSRRSFGLASGGASSLCVNFNATSRIN